MIEKLICTFFTKIKEKEFLKNKNAIATFVVEELLEQQYNKPNYIAIRTVTRLYDKYVEKKENISVKEPDQFLRNVMAKYLGFENFEYFITANNKPLSTDKNTIENDLKNSSDITDIDFCENLNDCIDIRINDNTKSKKVIKKNKDIKNTIITTITFISLVLVSYIFLNNSKKECVIWENGKYIEVKCEKSFNTIHKSKIYIDISSFKQIHPNNGFTFFREGKPVVFYGKNTKGKIEYFNHLTFHPETKKPLKGITRYILEKEGLLNE